ncbi:MAG: ABC-F family ATP-binding cassette domain-containing protein [Chlamydiota bacterium]
MSRKILIKAAHISKAYGSKVVLNNSSLSILEKDSLGLIGENGSGKSTFCKILQGQETPDSGCIERSEGIKIGYLAQEIEAPSKMLTVEEYFESFFRDLHRIQEEMLLLEQKLQTDANEKLLSRYGELQELVQNKGGWDLEYRVKKIMQGLRLDYIDQKQLFSTLSEGEKRRITLALLLIDPPDLLILDEPTNHLDFQTLQWLEEYLMDYQKSLLVISHDREFLNAITNKIAEISLYTHEITLFHGNYDQFLIEKEKNFEKSLSAYENYLTEVKELKELLKKKSFSSKGPKPPSDSFKSAWNLCGEKAEKSKSSQIQAIKVKLQRLEENPIQKPRQSALKGFRFYDTAIPSQVPIKIKGISKSFDEKKIFCEINQEILKNDRIILVGENGSGKSTLLRLLMGEEKPDSGEVTIATSVKIAYLDAEQKTLHAENTVLEEYALVKQGEEGALREDLHKLGLFTSQEVFLQIKNLSLGQKQKLMLAKIIAIKPNLLILDEPTNHLDLIAVEELEKALKNFSGAILAVSHDRRFIKNIASDVWHVKDQKLLSENQKEVLIAETILKSL